jgi:subtilisin family serine protease
MKSTLPNSYLTFFRRAIVFGLLLTYASPTYTQTIISRLDKSGKVSHETHPPGVVITSIVQGDSILATYTLDLNEEVGVIVQFKSPPLAAIKGEERIFPLAKLTSALAQIEEVHRSFKQDISRVEREALSQPNTVFMASNTKVGFGYKTAFNGVALRTRRWFVEEMKKLPYIQSVHEDKEVKTLDNESNHIIGADSVWLRLGVTGKGIIIGIIDTGVDYLHPALGGGFGPNSKVIGGYDFVNDDADPMDDNGHGTHVAGISAGNGGGLKGVAPDAKLIALKVLDAEGSGKNSWVIAGIERALDPDKNPSTNDAVHVINLSLGGSGDPDDPLSQAVDNAASSGVVCVVAAGNSGGYQTISSPGGARRALTVGATDKIDVLASFSSRGPSTNIFGIKPDVVAPGVDINSAKMGGGEVRFSGTSMAAPHVAGAAALLLERNPSWTPEVLKAALMESAKDLGGQTDIWSQGSGRINVYRAARMEAVLTPGSVSFGIVDLSQSVWTRSDTLYLRNLSSTPKTFDLSIAGSFPAGVTLNLSHNNLTVSPNQSAQIVLGIAVSNTIVPFPTTDPPAYVGKFIARSSSDTLAIPFSFIKSPILQVTFDEEPWILFVHNRVQPVEYKFRPYPGNRTSLALPAGLYDLIVTFKDVATKVIKEGVSVGTLTAVSVSKTDAKNEVTLRTFDPQGKEIRFDNNGVSLVVHKTSGVDQIFFGGFAQRADYEKLYFSDVSSSYKYEALVMAWSDATGWNRYDFPFALPNGISSSLSLQNDPKDFREVVYKYFAPTNFQKLFVRQWTSQGLGFSVTTYYTTETSPNILVEPFQRKLYFLPDPSPDYTMKYTYQDVFGFVGPNFDHPVFKQGDDVLLYSSSHHALSGDSIKMYLRFDFEQPIQTYAASAKIPLGFGPPRWSGRLYNNPNSEGIFLSYDPIHAFGYFVSPMGDVWDGKLPYRLLREGQLLQSDSLLNRTTGAYYDDLSVPGGAYELEIGFDRYAILDSPGRATAKLRFDTRKPDGNPPYLKSLRVLSNGRDADGLELSNQNEIRFRIKDDNFVSRVILFYRSGNDTTWRSFPLSNQDDLYSTTIPNNLPTGFISLRVLAEDNSGNILDYKVEPAFRFGINRAPSAFKLIFPLDKDTVRLTVPKKLIRFTWRSSSDPDGDILRYNLRVGGPELDTTFTQLADTTIDLNIMSRLQTGASYTWNVTVDDGLTSVASLDSFTFRTSSTVTAIEEIAGDLPKEYALHQSYPNPFNPSTTIRYGLPARSVVRLAIYNVLGQVVTELVNGEKETGYHEVQWQAQSSSGMYFYRLEATQVDDPSKRFVDVKKMVILR